MKQSFSILILAIKNALPHFLTVVVPAGIATVPANLESTTLSVFYGLDLFFTRIQPSKTFDLLPDDFPYAMLILVFLTLFIGSVALRRLDEKKAVKRKWN